MILILLTAEAAFAQNGRVRVGYDAGYRGVPSSGTYYATRADSGVVVFGNTTTGAFGNPVNRYPSTVIYTQPIRTTPIYNYQTPVYYTPPIYYGQSFVGYGINSRTHRWGR
jgi:hypothetical protein